MNTFLLNATNEVISPLGKHQFQILSLSLWTIHLFPLQVYSTVKTLSL